MVKTLTLILVFSFTAFSGVSDIKLSCDFENGYIPMWRTMSYQSRDFYTYAEHTPTFFTSTSPKFKYKGFYVMSDYTFYWGYQKGTTGIPFRSNFEFESGFTFKMITLKYAHRCNHNIVTIPDDLNTTPTLHDIAHDKFSVVVHIGN